LHLKPPAVPRWSNAHDRRPFASGLKPHANAGRSAGDLTLWPDALRIQGDAGATTKSAVSATFDLMELEIKHWASTPSMISRARSSSAWFLRLTRGRTATSLIWYLPSTCSSRPSAPLSYPVGVRPLERRLWGGGAWERLASCRYGGRPPAALRGTRSWGRP